MTTEVQSSTHPSPTQTASPNRGRNRITARALDKVATAVSADTLGVERRGVSVRLEDDAGVLALHVTTPVRVVSLASIAADPGLVERTGGTLLERADRAQDEIRSRLGALTGSSISRVTVRLSGVEIKRESRVR